jgi:hypothetical protein
MIMHPLLKTALSTLVAGVALACFGAVLYLLDQDIFWGVLWYIFIASFLKVASREINSKRSRIVLYLTAILLGFIWIIANSSAYHLLAQNINTNPYGEYFISQFEFRLQLSLFMLKFVSKAWLTDVRLLVVILLFVSSPFTFPAIFKKLSSLVPLRYFEFFVHSCTKIKDEVISYCAPRLTLFMVNTLLWCLAAFLLRFDNFVILTAIMAICTLTPTFGLFLAAALSVLYVESGLFMLQLGGIFIGTASVWFIDYTIFKDRPLKLSNGLSIALILLLPLGYVIFSFPGLFAAAPITFLSVTIGSIVAKNTRLIHNVKAS